MARRARATNVAQSGNLTVNDEMRVVADLILRNLCKTITVSSITEALLGAWTSLF